MLRLGLFLVFLAQLPGVALASPADVQVRAARELEQQLRFDDALRAWRAAAEADGTARQAEVAATSIQRLEARRDADGGFEGLRALERARRGSAPGAVETVLEVWEDDGTAPPVRLDAGIWLASRALEHGRGEDALELTSTLWTRHRDGPAAVRVADVHARALVKAGRLDEAERVEAAVSPVTAPWSLAQQGRLERRRRVMAALSVVGLLGFLGLALAPSTRAARRRPLPLPVGLLPVALLAGGAALLAQLWEPGLGEPLLQLGLLLGILHVLAALALSGEGRPRVRLALRGLAAWATLGLAFLVLDRASLLGWVGL